MKIRILARIGQHIKAAIFGLQIIFIYEYINTVKHVKRSNSLSQKSFPHVRRSNRFNI